ncbi:zinc finger CCCH domain-containing protein 10-like [Tachypleus tridentatus]|uniref:zinc finger CCCH domain-containing protein 10-like n=1 Tax=Tachypleus tridentatus TaxID=6853 RepID=UPI003FD69072
MAESDNGNERGNVTARIDDDICRDFLRNVCSRGSNCKYKHPEPEKENQEGGNRDIKFCRDFQNRGCRRANCKFVHCTKREEEYYISTGKLPRHVQETLGEKVPVCKDFLRGFCKRGIYCKFRHLTTHEYEMEMGGGRGIPVMGDSEFDDFGYEFQPQRKRPAFDSSFATGDGQDGPGVLLPTPGSDPMANTSMPDVQMLEGENSILRRKVEELKKQVTELTSTVEYLLEQNAQLRASKQSSMPPINPSPKSYSFQSSGPNTTRPW